MPIEIGIERRILLHLQSGKQRAGVARLIVVGTQHLGRHRLAEAAAAGDTAVAVLRIESRIDNRYQRCLIYILVSHNVTELTIASIDISTHILQLINPTFKTILTIVSLLSGYKYR